MMIFVVSCALLFVLCDCFMLKECTNQPTQISSHTFRYELLTSNNQSWRDEVFAHYHLIHTDDSAWASLLPRKILREEDEYSWAVTYRKLKNRGGLKMQGGILNEVSLHDVRLGPDSMHWRAQQTNLEYLLMLDVDRLVWSFRKTSGLPTVGEPYGGWETPTIELRGHFVGHYLSASALMWASTHNDTLKEKMTAVVSALSACQKQMGTGYLSAFPSEFFDRFEAVEYVWAPYYTIHKILAGLLDQYTFAGNEEALKTMTWMVDYFYNRVQNVITKYTVARHWRTLNEEFGGMNDVLYKLYSITEDPKHLLLAHLFDKPCFLGLLAVKADDLSGFHSNSHIPIVVGSQMRYEVTGDPLYKEIGKFFMDIVNSSHAFATGGTSAGEFWVDPKRLASTLSTENEESCTTYNMLKVSRHLFTWTKDIAYADYYERALTNGVLPIQRGTDPGVMIYMLPLVPGGSKARSYHGWGTQFDSFWCCYGTGIESFSKLGDSIYFEEGPSLYIIQYISSSLDWKSGKIVLNQQVAPVVSWNPYLRVTLTISSNQGAGESSTLNLRIPTWTLSNGAKATLNGQSLSLPAPGHFLPVTRKWSPGDKLSLELPITLRTEPIKDERPEYSSIQAILYGPYLLAGHTNGDWDLKTSSATSLSDWITPVPGTYNSQLVSLAQDSGNSSFVITKSDQLITMENFPASGTDSAVNATFRLITKDPTSMKYSSAKDCIGKSVMLEPFTYPRMVLVQTGKDNNLAVEDSSAGDAAVFNVVKGLDGRTDTISLESGSLKGCFIYSGVNYGAGANVKLACNADPLPPGFNEAASFVVKEGISQYDPISFVAKGATRNFLLAPLFSFRDEAYTAYFNIQA